MVRKEIIVELNKIQKYGTRQISKIQNTDTAWYDDTWLAGFAVGTSAMLKRLNKVIRKIEKNGKTKV